MGFALAHALREDSSWQMTLSQLSGSTAASAAIVDSEDALIVHELAVRESERGRGIAGACMSALLQDLPQSRTFIGVYERATDADSTDQHWQLSDIGQVPMPDGAIALHVLTGLTAEILARVGTAQT